MTPARALRCGRHVIDLGRPRVMGVVNVTPDSFSDGGRHFAPEAALRRGEQMLDAGVDLIDVGGESTRPGAAPVDEVEELRRVLPVVRALALRGAVVSIDTRHPAVMRAALGEGAALVNDVAALTAPGALEVVAGSEAAVCLMHMQGDPATMQRAPHYANVVDEVARFLRRRTLACLGAGIARDRIAIDPGFGFGKRLEHNVALVRDLSALVALGFPVVVGLSRKSMIAALIGRADTDRTAGSVAAALAAVAHGASIVRVHDVEATLDALRVWWALAGPDADWRSRRNDDAEEVLRD